MMKLYPHQNLTAHKRTYSLLGILANRYGIYFTIINLELKINENVFLTMLILLHNDWKPPLIECLLISLAYGSC